MDSYLGVRWDEWFILSMYVFTLGAPVFFLIYFFRRHYLDDPDCSKNEVFTTDPSMRPDEMPRMSNGCQPAYLSKRPWWNSVNVDWIWVTLGIGGVWLFITVIAFIASRGIPEMRQALPM